MLAAMRPYGLSLFKTGLDRILGSGSSLAAKLPQVTSLAAEAGSVSGFKQFALAFINQAKSWIKPLLAVGPLAWLLSYSKGREVEAIAKIDEKFSEAKSTHELSQHHKDLEKQNVYQFIPAQGTGAKPLVIVGLGTMQDFHKQESGLMQVVDHLRKNQPNVHILVLKAPDASKALQHLFCINEDASANTDVKTKENINLIKDVIKGRGNFSGVKVLGVCPVGFSWGAGMLCEMRKQGVFDNLRVPILGTATIDAIKPGLENLGEGLTDLGNGKEPNLHIYQDETYYGLNGACAKGLGAEDEVCKHAASSHEELDNDPWAIAKVSQFLDKVLAVSPSKNNSTSGQAEQ